MNENSVSQTTIQIIPIDQLKPNPWNRTVFDPDALLELTASVKADGIKEPPIVRPLPEGGYQIASGHRRWLAAQNAGLKEIRCWVSQINDEDVARDNIALNVQRENIPPLELARMVNDYMEKFEKNQPQAAQQFGKTQTWVSQLISFLGFDELVKENIKALMLGWDQLRALKASPHEVQTQVAQELKDDKLKPDQVAKRCKELSAGKGKGDGKDPQDPEGAPQDPFGGVWEKAQHEPMDSKWTVGLHKKVLAKNNPRTFYSIQIGPMMPGTESKVMAQWCSKIASRVAPPPQGASKVPVAASTPVATSPALATPPQPRAVVVQPPPAPKAPAYIAAARVAVPIPEPQEATFVSGDRMQIKWLDLGPGYSYQVMFAEDPERPRFEPVPSSPTVKTPGAIVNIFSQGQSKKVLIAVQAIDPQGHPSELSQPVEFDLKPWNKEYSVLPLPLNVIKPTAPATAAPVPVVTEAVPPTQPNKPLDPRIAALVAEHADKEAIQ